MERVLHAFQEAGLSLVSRAYFLRVLGRFGDFEVLLDAYGSSSTSIDVAHFLEWLKPEVPPQLQASAASAASASALVEDLARRSVTLRTLLKFLRSLPKTMPHFNVERTRTVDVVWQVIIPETATRGCSYAELLESERRLPDKMISHNWGNLFAHLMAAVFADAAGKPSFSAILSWLQLGAKGLDMIEALIEDAGQLDSTRWLCIFAVNQHISICDSTWGCRDSVTNVPFTGCGCKRRKFHSGPRCEMDKFDAMITLFKQKKPGYEHILAVDSQVGLLNRIWVVAEVAEVFRQELPCKVVLHQPSSDLEEKTMALNVWTAEASRPEDVSMILDKIEDKDVFNERTKAALLAVGYLASLEAHVEMRYHLRGISSAEADAAFLRTVDACRAKLRQLRASQSEVLEIWRSFNEDEKIGSSDRDTKAMIALVNMIRECDLMLPECFIKTYREAAFPEAGYHEGMSDEEVYERFWQMRTGVRSVSQLPHVYMDGPALMAVLAKWRPPHASVLCLTCPQKKIGEVYKMGYHVQMTEQKFPSHLITLVHTVPDAAGKLVIHRGLDEEPRVYEGPFEGSPMARFIVQEALPFFGVLHEANRIHYSLRATGCGLFTIWLGHGDISEEIKTFAKDLQELPRKTDIPCCFLNSEALSKEPLGRFFHDLELEVEPVAMLFLGDFASSPHNVDHLKRFMWSLKSTDQPADLLAFIEAARRGEIEGEEIQAAKPLLKATYLAPPDLHSSCR